MSLTVCKFGGSSVSDAEMFVRVNRIIRDDSSRRYIVLSAPGKRSAEDEKITDLLYRAHETFQNGDGSILAQIFSRYASIRDALAPDFDLESEFAQLRRDLPSSLDYAASRGEYLCAKLFAAYARMPFVDAAGLFCFTGDGKIDYEASRSAIKAKLTPLECAVIPGFYGRDAHGNIRTFSRGGSDVSGALIAASIGADLYENWTDVDGLFTADPCIVPQARRNLCVSLTQMEKIAAAGAKLMHPEALIPLRGTGIDTMLKNTFSPGNTGTRISERCSDGVLCVTGQRNLYMIGDPEESGASNLLLHSLPMQGSVKVSAIRAFGMNDETLKRACDLLKPIHIIHMQDHIQIIIPDKEYESSLRAIHAMLLAQ